MDQKKKQGAQVNQSQGGHQRSQQTGQPDRQSQNPNRDHRDQPDRTRQEMPGRDQPGQRYTHDEDDDRGRQSDPRPQSTPERGGNRSVQNSERNSSSGGGISNRGMDSEEEQEDLPDRGDRQSER
jgi:hypothetical protein